ncbi:MAG: NusG domain II-containing protein [Coriobacteriia bacterium]|nr:NusG domain II-containing protein [Coriobacteriia bacterium]
MTRGDRIVVAVVGALALAAVPLSSRAIAGPEGGVTVRSPQGVSRFAEDARLKVAGSRGELVVEVAGGRARVLEADCPDQVCVRSGWSSAGRPVVCAPNRVVIESAGGSLDAVSR